MVTVYFTNGHEAQMPKAVKVEERHFAAMGVTYQGIICRDAEGKEVGRFRTTEIVG